VYTTTAGLLWKWAPREWLRIQFEPGYRFVNNAGHIAGQTAGGFEAAFSLKFIPGMRKTHEFN
jgi:hypothetical protein